MAKYLVIRFSSIGDIVLTTPVLRCIKKQKPGSEIHFITKKAFKAILENNPNVDKIFTIDKDVEEVVADLKKEEYDHIIDLHHNLRSTILKRKLKRPSSTFPKLNIKKILLTKLKINRLPDLHVVDRYFEAVKAIDVHNDLLVCDFIIPTADQIDLSEMGIPNDYIAFAIGAQKATKCLPVEKLIELIQKIKLPVVLIGGETDFDKAEKIKTKCPEVFNLCGRLNLNQSAWVVKQSNKLVTHDTGMMHIASSFRKNTVSIWGNTVKDFGMFPYMPMNPGQYTIHEVPNLKCRPCSKIGYDQCPKKHFNCMNLQDISAIARDING